MRREWLANMKTTREKFVEHYAVLYHKELLERLPPEECVTVMLHRTNQIIADLNNHLVAAIFQNINKKED